MAQAVSHCVACDTNNPIVWKCLDCDFSMCDTCKTAHERFPATKRHVVKDIKEINPEDMKVVRIYQECKIHNKDISMYCSSCQVFVCVDCISENHGKHDLDKIQNIVEEKWKEAETVIKEAAETKDGIASEVDYIKEVEENLEENATKTYEAMKQREKEMKRSIEEQFQQCASEIEIQKSMAIKALDEYKQNLSKLSSETDDDISLIQRCLDNKDITTLTIQTSDIKDKLQSIQISYNQQIPVFSFKEGQQPIFGNVEKEGHMLTNRYMSNREIKKTKEICKFSDPSIKDEQCLQQRSKEDLQAPDPLMCHHEQTSKRMFYSCGHKFCKECIHKRNCPVCGKNYDMVLNMFNRCMHDITIRTTKDENGYTITFYLKFFFQIATWRAWLPMTQKGSLVFELLKIAFDRGLLFKEGYQYTEISSTELSAIITRNVIGEGTLPSSEDVDAVILYLESKGVTEIDI